MSNGQKCGFCGCEDKSYLNEDEDFRAKLIEFFLAYVPQGREKNELQVVFNYYGTKVDVTDMLDAFVMEYNRGDFFNTEFKTRGV